ncbi:hypothetical protein SAMN04487945_0443 [Halobacterium jilantaiense]|uniref:Uncharacterized protein n=1 Tax=Halobacterium jilantaiense TaxID=355548 RepID=A0A1I0MXF6_9EURY|nr:hypothetical protein SAMN04487945_0443 [Halobacterium jilantaiense]
MVFLTAGCLSPAAAPQDSPSTTDTVPTTTEPTTSRTVTTTVCGWSCLDDQPDPHHSVQLENNWNQRVDVHVRVIRSGTNTTVHNETYALEPGSERTAYDVAEIEPEGIETFDVAITALNTTENTEIRTTKCFGNAFARIRDDGALFASYSIC